MELTTAGPVYIKLWDVSDANRAVPPMQCFFLLARVSAATTRSIVLHDRTSAETLSADVFSKLGPPACKSSDSSVINRKASAPPYPRSSRCVRPTRSTSTRSIASNGSLPPLHTRSAWNTSRTHTCCISAKNLYVPLTLARDAFDLAISASFYLSLHRACTSLKHETAEPDTAPSQGVNRREARVLVDLEQHVEVWPRQR
jgi:hypothetical protein